MANKIISILIVFLLVITLILTSLVDAANYSYPKGTVSGTGYKKVCLIISVSIDILDQLNQPISNITFENASNFYSPQDALKVLVATKSIVSNVSLNGSLVTLKANGGKFLLTGNATITGKLDTNGTFTAEWMPSNRTMGTYEFKASLVSGKYCGSGVRTLNATLKSGVALKPSQTPTIINGKNYYLISTNITTAESGKERYNKFKQFIDGAQSQRPHSTQTQ